MEKLEAALFVNGVRQDDHSTRTWYKEGDKSHNISFSGLITLAADDAVSISFSMENSGNIELEMANLSLNKID